MNIEAVGSIFNKDRDDVNPLAAAANNIMSQVQNLPQSKAEPVLEAVEQINNTINNMLQLTSMMANPDSTSNAINLQSMLNDLKRAGDGLSMIAAGNNAGASVVKEAVSALNGAMAQIDISMVENAILNIGGSVKAAEKADPAEIALDFIRKGASIRI
ncbi:MAG: hypothetical protein AABZ57_04990 [Candidatus Margulisiibacteriota bacterium]